MTGFEKPPTRLWRHDDGAMFAGVCAGLAEDLDLPLPLVRLVALLFLVLPTGLAYVALGVLMRRRPAVASAFASGMSGVRSAAADRSTGSPRTRDHTRPGVRPGVRPGARNGTGSLSPHQDWALLRHRFAALESRINRIEGVVTAGDFELHRDFRRMEP